MAATKLGDKIWEPEKLYSINSESDNKLFIITAFYIKFNYECGVTNKNTLF